jgi:outer membrane protein
MQQSIYKALIFLIIFGFSVPSFANTQIKLANIDMQRVLANTSGGKRVKQILQEEMNAKQKLIQANQTSLKGKKDAFEKDSLMWGPSKKLEEQKKLETEMMEFQSMVNKADGEIQRRQVELMQPVLIDIKRVVTQIAQEKRFDLVIEKNSSGVLYSANAQDITDEVTLAYEKNYGDKTQKKKK